MFRCTVQHGCWGFCFFYTETRLYQLFYFSTGYQFGVNFDLLILVLLIIFKGLHAVALGSPTSQDPVLRFSCGGLLAASVRS